MGMEYMHDPSKVLDSLAYAIRRNQELYAATGNKDYKEQGERLMKQLTDKHNKLWS